MRPATLELNAYVGEPRVYRLTFTDGVTPLTLTGQWWAQARRHPAAPDPVDIDVNTTEMGEGVLTLTIPGSELPNRSARWVYDLEGETWGTVLAGPLLVSSEVTRLGETTGGSITDLVIALGPDEVKVVSAAALGPKGDTHVPNPAEEPDDRWLTTEGGALVYTDAPSGGGGNGNGAATAALGLSGVLAYDVPARAAGPVGNSDSGHAWTAERGTWEVTASGRLAATGLASDRAILLLPDLGARMATVEATLTGDARVSSQLAGGLVVAYIDATNYLYVTNSGSPALTIRQVVGGVETDLATANWSTGANGQSVAMRLLGGMGGRSSGAGGRAVGSIKNYLLNAVSSVDITPYLSGVIRQGLISFNTDARFQDVAVRQAEYGT